MPKQFYGFNRNEKLVILENRLVSFDERFKQLNKDGCGVPEHIYRDFCHNKKLYLEEIENVVKEATYWVESVGLFRSEGE